MIFTNADQVISYMTAKSGKFGNFTLQPMLDICAKYDDFQKSLTTIHVAGTNGKGSTSHFLASMLQKSGLTVGLFTSPYFIHHRDRIRINDEWIDETAMVDIANRYYHDFEHFGLSFFEIDTFIALRYFYEKKVSVAVVEVGMGGRLDATNVIVPVVSVITNIGYDHMEYLGDTLAKIAFEKAGIIKPNRPVVIGCNMDSDAESVIREVAALNKSQVIKASMPNKVQLTDHISFDYEGVSYELSTPVHYQPINAALAIAAIQVFNRHCGSLAVNEVALKQGLYQSVWHGRFEVIHRHPTWIIDGAHNAHGMAALVDALSYYRKEGQKVHVLFAVLKDKPIAEMIALLQPLVDDFTMTTFSHYRQLDLNTFVAPLGVRIEKDYQKLLDQWMNKTTNQQDLYVITGSLYFLTEVVHYCKSKGWSTL